MTDRLRRVGCQVEVAAFDREISRDDDFFARARRQDCAVISNTDANQPPRSRAGTNSAQQCTLTGVIPLCCARTTCHEVT